MLRYDALHETALKTDPYPYMVLPDAFEEGQLQAVLSDFPEIQHQAVFPLLKPIVAPVLMC